MICALNATALCLLLVVCSGRGQSSTVDGRRHLFFDDYCDRTTKDVSLLTDLSNWMATLDKTTQLASLTLPGTHHSASYDLSTTVNPNDPEYAKINDATYGIDVPEQVIAPWICRFALTQSLSISEQLQAGIRYFDLRVDLDSSGETESTFRAFHVLFGLPVEVLLGQIADFVRGHPTEIVLVELSELFNPDVSTTDKANLQQIILDAFGDLLLPERENLPTLGEMQDAGTTVIVAIQDNEVADSALLWNNDVLRNTFADTVDLSTMISYNTEMLAEFETSKDLFNKLSWTLTPDSEYIKDSIVFGSLYDLASEANGALQAFADDNEGRQLGSVLLLDYFETSPLFDVLELSGKSDGEFKVEPGSTSTEGWTTGQKVGVAVGALVAVLILICLVKCMCC